MVRRLACVVHPSSQLSNHAPMLAGLLAQFLKDFGPALFSKYGSQLKAIVMFSAHWEGESDGTILVSDYGEKEYTPLYHDFYNFPREVYKALTFQAKGDDQITRKILDLLQKVRLSFCFP